MKAEEIQALRDRLKMTLAEMSALLGMGLRGLQRWVGGERKAEGAALRLLMVLDELSQQTDEPSRELLAEILRRLRRAGERAAAPEPKKIKKAKAKKGKP